MGKDKTGLGICHSVLCGLMGYITGELNYVHTVCLTRALQLPLVCQELACHQKRPSTKSPNSAPQQYQHDLAVLKNAGWRFGSHFTAHVRRPKHGRNINVACCQNRRAQFFTNGRSPQRFLFVSFLSGQLFFCERSCVQRASGENKKKTAAWKMLWHSANTRGLTNSSRLFILGCIFWMVLSWHIHWGGKGWKIACFPVTHEPTKRIRVDL